MLLRTFHIVFLLAIVAIVGACRSASHTRNDQRSTGITTRSGIASPNRSSISGPSYRVARGDTVYGIAFRNGVDFRDLARWNNISSPFTFTWARPCAWGLLAVRWLQERQHQRTFVPRRRRRRHQSSSRLHRKVLRLLPAPVR